MRPHHQVVLPAVTEQHHLERRELQLTILAAVIVLVLAGGLAAFMYPLVFLHPVGNKWTLRVAFFGFCGLTLLFVGYLLERQRTGAGLQVEVSMLRAAMDLQIEAATYAMNGARLTKTDTPLASTFHPPPSMTNVVRLTGISLPNNPRFTPNAAASSWYPSPSRA